MAEVPKYSARRISQLMWDRGWYQQDLANETGYSQSHVSNVLNGRQEITDRFAYLAARAFDVEVAELETVAQQSTAQSTASVTAA